MDKRRAIGWLILGGLGGVCLAVSIVTAVDPIPYSPSDSLRSLCCRLAEGLSRYQTSPWFRASLVVAGIMLLALASRNLALR